MIAGVNHLGIYGPKSIGLWPSGSVLVLESRIGPDPEQNRTFLKISDRSGPLINQNFNI